MLNGIAGSRDGYGLMPGTALALEHGHIAWIGPQTDIPSQYNGKPYDCSGRLVTAAPLDCHTHVVHGGNRAGEFEMRLRGASYEEVARAGGGIVSTVKATRAANLDQLVASTLPRVDAMLAEGVSTIEIKSGYGLDRETERDMLRAARRIGEVRPVRICTTFLGAHAVPAEYAGRADAYIDEVCLPALDAAHAEGLVDAVDGFCEGIAFTPQQIGRVFDHADGLGLPVKLHAEQLSDLGGAVMAARRGAQSADHVEYAGPEAAAAMAKSGTVAVLLPGAFYTLHETKKPPVEAFREHGVPMALATDCNPGSSPMSSILLAMNMGCTLFGLTPEEALRGVTVNAARALGLSDTGRVEVGCRADLAVWDVAHPAELAYRIGFNPLDIRIFEGNIT
ncbi:MAG: imidazolonepropionase [Pseudomonadota bacterium]